jgi:hypothetical protein
MQHLSSEFIKLSNISVRPCIACLGCKGDNICKVEDDFPGLAEKVRNAGAVVVGGYTPYGAVDGFTKAFLERLFSLRHQSGLGRGRAYFRWKARSACCGPRFRSERSGARSRSRGLSGAWSPADDPASIRPRATIFKENSPSPSFGPDAGLCRARRARSARRKSAWPR